MNRFNIKEWQDEHVKKPLQEATNKADLLKFEKLAKKYKFKNVGNKHDKYVDKEDGINPIVTYHNSDFGTVQVYTEDGRSEYYVFFESDLGSGNDGINTWTRPDTWEDAFNDFDE